MLIKDIIASSEEKNFVTSAGSFNISKDQSIYNGIRKKYFDIAQKTTEDFINKWKSYEEINALVQSVEGDFLDAINSVADQLKNDLICMEIYDYDNGAIIDKAQAGGCFNSYMEAKQIFDTSIGAIQQELNQKVANREANLDKVGNWQGGTMSVGERDMVESYKDEAKFQAELAARNVAETAAMSVFNAIGNSVSASNATKKMNNIFLNVETIKSIGDGLEETLWSFHLILLQIIGKDDVWNIASSEGIAKAERLLNNADNELLADDVRSGMIVESFSLNPYSEDLYMKLISMYKGDVATITDLATYFCIDLSSRKDIMAVEYVESIIGTTEEESWEAKNLLMAYYKDNSMEFSEGLASYQLVDGKVQAFDLEYRTVDGIECTTREASDDAKVELEKITEFMAEIEVPQKESLLEYEVELLAKKEEYTCLFTSELKDKYLNVIVGYEQEFEKNFLSVGMFKSKDRKEAGIKRAVKFAKEQDVSSDGAVSIAKDKVKGFLPSVGVSEDEAAEAFVAIDKNRDKLVNPSGAQQALNKLGGFFKK